jgi:hypothetical protein
MRYCADTNLTDGVYNLNSMKKCNPNLDVYEAQRACVNYVSDNRYTGWYLPALCEMGSGGSCTSGNNLVDELYKRKLGNFSQRIYWSSSALQLDRVYGLSFLDLQPYMPLPTTYQYVRCIRIIN